MPLLQGEVSLLSLYADVHYYFGPPTPKTSHHRFDKRSYVYLYHDALNRRGRLEIANYAGTADQDAFQGYLDSSDIQYSYKHPTLFTITVTSPRSQGATPSPPQDISQWHLPAAGDAQAGQGRFMYKLHTIDLYFWTIEDAGLFLDSLKRVTAPGQLRILDANTSHPEHRDSMSPVVQQLEKVAISSPPAAPVPQRVGSSTTMSSIPVVSPLSNTTSLPSPPPPAAGIPVGTPVGIQADQPAESFAPMAYNPAAPAAPEPIAHREKTPPPPDADTGTGLAQAAVHEHINPSFGPQAGQQSFNPLQQQFVPQPTAVTMAAPYSQAPNMGVQRSNTMGVPTNIGYVQQHVQQPPTPASMHGMSGPPTATSPYDQQQQQVYAQQAPPQGVVRQSTMPAAPPYSASPYGASFGSQGTPPSGMVATGLPSPGIYSPYGTAQPGFAPSPYQPQQVMNSTPYGINHSLHQALYIPEAATKHEPQPGPGAASGLEQRFKAVDKSVSGTFKGFMKKLDKKI